MATSDEQHAAPPRDEREGRGWFRGQRFRRASGLAWRLWKRKESQLTLEERIEMVEAQIQFFIRTTGVDGGPTNNARALLASYLEDADRWLEARVLREEVLDARRRNLGTEESPTVTAELALAVNLSHAGLNVDALPLALHAREGFRNLEDRENSDLANDWVAFIRTSGGLE